MYSKQIGNFTIVSDNKPELNGYFSPDGQILARSDIWKGNVFYEQDYFALYSVTNLHVVDQNQIPCTPIIEKIDVESSGYVFTFNAIFWVQGFAILDNEIFFISIGDESNYNCKEPIFHKLNPDYSGGKVSYEEFIKTLPQPVFRDYIFDRGNRWLKNNPLNIDNFMLT